MSKIIPIAQKSVWYVYDARWGGGTALVGRSLVGRGGGRNAGGGSLPSPTLTRARLGHPHQWDLTEPDRRDDWCSQDLRSGWRTPPRHRTDLQRRRTGHPGAGLGNEASFDRRGGNRPPHSEITTSELLLLSLVFTAWAPGGNCRSVGSSSQL